MNYSEAMSFIHSVEWQGSRPGLERITELSEMMSHPEGSFSAVHVAGTNALLPVGGEGYFGVWHCRLRRRQTGCRHSC